MSENLLPLRVIMISNDSSVFKELARVEVSKSAEPECGRGTAQIGADQYSACDRAWPKLASDALVQSKGEGPTDHDRWSHTCRRSSACS